MPTLHLVRRGVLPVPPLAGALVTVPPQPNARSLDGIDLDALPPGDDALLTALGHDALLAGVGRPSQVVLHGLHDATAWETRFVAWACARLGVEVPVPSPAPTHPLGASFVEPLRPWPAPDGRVALLHGDALDLEAIGAARWLRERLLALPIAAWDDALSDMLVLVPAHAGRVRIWARTLREHGLPVAVRVARPLADHPLARWLIALVEVAAWDREPLQRDTLRRVLEAPFATAPVGLRRSDVRLLLSRLRRPRVRRAAWRAHVDAYFDALPTDPDDDTVAPRREATHAHVDRLVSTLGAPAEAGFFGRLRHLLGDDGLRVAGRLRAAGADDALAALDRCVRVLDALDEVDDGLDVAFPTRARREALHDALAARRQPLDSQPSVGVRLQTWPGWDGRGARWVVLAGLEEGGWPSPPARPSRDDEAIAARLGLDTPSDALRRQARVAALALGSAREAALVTWSTLDHRGAQTFPGALLAGRALPDSPAEAWRDHTTHVHSRDALVTRPDQATAPDHLVAVAPLTGLPDLPHPIAARCRTAAQAADHRAHVRAARAPEAPVAPGPYTGGLGVPVGRETYSPTSLETLGQCGAKYFLAKVLRIEKPDDAGSTLDALETGSFLHDGLAHAALEAIAARGVWVLSDPERPVEEIVHETLDAFQRGARRSLDALRAAQPTLGGGMLHYTIRRWDLALERALRAEAAIDPPGSLAALTCAPSLDDLSDPELDALAAQSGIKAVADEVRAFCAARAALERAASVVDEARTAAFTSQSAAKAWLKERGSCGISQAAFGPVAVGAEPERTTALNALLDKPRATCAARAEKAQARLDALWAEHRVAVQRRVVAAEWGFGPQYADSLADPRSVEAPLVVDTPHGPLALAGRVDRVDLDPVGERAAVVDYKSGMAKSDGKLLRELELGLHLQLPLYARAVEALGRDALALGDGRVEVGRLAFIKEARSSLLWLDEASTRFVVEPGDDEVGPAALVDRHLAHAAWRMSAGSLPLAPRRCPLEGESGAYCDFQRVCGYQPNTRHLIVEQAPQPFGALVTTSGAGKGSKAKAPPPFEALRPVPEPPAPSPGVVPSEVYDTSRDVVVSAGAGSGKTYALAERYVRAVAEGASPAHLLAITFTRKATAEMRARVREHLLTRRPEGLGDEALRDALFALGAAPILTIDAFAGLLVSELRDETIAVTDDADRFRDEWVEARLLDAAEDPSPALDALLQAWTWDHVQQAIRALLADPAHLAKLADVRAETLFDRWLEALHAALPSLDDDLARLSGLRDDLEALRDDGLATAKAQASADALQATLDEVAEACGDGVLQALVVLPRLRWSVSGSGDDDRFSALCGEVFAIRARWGASSSATKRLVDALVSSPHGDEATFDAEQALRDEAALAALLIGVARDWQGDLERARERAGVFGYDEVLAHALAACREATPDRKRAFAERYPIAHLFVDELQDTNEAQVALVHAVRDLLATHGVRAPRLFLVGDPKQSIYRFRGAEVDVFEAALTDDTVRLEVGRRSHPQLTRAIDRLFARLFDGALSDGTALDPLAAVPWSALAPRDLGITGDDDLSPRVDLVLMGTGDAPPDDDASADEGDDDPVALDPSGALTRLIGAHAAAGRTVAVLTHSWALATRWGQTLQSAGVPAFVQGGSGLLSSPAVVPLMQVLDALERDDDDLAWAGLLRGPLVGLSDPGLFALRHGHGVALPALDGAYAPTTGRVPLSRLRHGFRFDAEAAIAALGLDGGGAAAVRRDAARVAAFQAWWPALRASWGVVGLDETVRLLVQQSAYEAILLANETPVGLANLRAFRNLVDEVASAPTATPSEAVRRLRRAAESGDDPSDGGGNLYAGDAPVTVTVVHQAKGLEWDVVVLPEPARARVRTRIDDLGAVRLALPGREPTLLPVVKRVHPARPFAMTRGPSAEIVDIATVAAERAEQRRLLYVACTRARERLIVGLPLPAFDAAGARATLHRVRARLGTHAPSLAQSTGWFGDLALGLQLDVEPPPEVDDADAAPEVAPDPRVALRVDPGVWVEGRDFRWIHEVDALPPLTAPPAPTTPPTERLLRVAHAPAPPPITFVLPSSEIATGPAPAPTLIGTARDLALGPSPFAQANHAGDAVHALFERWSFRGPLTRALAHDALAARFAPLAPTSARVDWSLAAVRAAVEALPALADRLRAAAEDGRVWHEAALRLPHPERPHAVVVGSIDLLWQEADGGWHLLDYKTSTLTDDGHKSLEARASAYHPQVALYAAALQPALGGALRTYGLWFVEHGVVAQWTAA